MAGGILIYFKAFAYAIHVQFRLFMNMLSLIKLTFGIRASVAPLPCLILYFFICLFGSDAFVLSNWVHFFLEIIYSTMVEEEFCLIFFFLHCVLYLLEDEFLWFCVEEDEYLHLSPALSFILKEVLYDCIK